MFLSCFLRLPISQSVWQSTLLIPSRLHYCDAVPFALTKQVRNQLQLIQNFVVHMLTRTRRREQITPVFKSLCCFHVTFRIVFKFLYFFLPHCLTQVCMSHLVIGQSFRSSGGFHLFQTAGLKSLMWLLAFILRAAGTVQRSWQQLGVLTSLNINLKLPA